MCVDARMVEIKVYSTVGTSWYESPKFRGVSAGMCGKDAVEVCGTAEERATNGVKDVVKMVAAPLCKIPTHGWS